MPSYSAPISDMQFLLHQWLNISEHYAQIDKAELDAELVNDILEQGAKFAEQAVAPLNRSGDEQGCTLSDGKVTTPDGFAAAYQEYIENGWNAMLGSEEFGGQALPYSMAIPFHEMLMSANLSWRLLCGLTESAILALEKHAEPELQARFLPKLITGEWTGTMCLTEPQAGTDLSLLKTKAEPLDDGSYSITGSKIFISGGDHDWTNNIVHLVLARLPDAPAGVKGISLFAVPKMNLDANGEPADANLVSVGSIEHKMGMHASPTCVLNFDAAQGWLVGAPHSGLACMFTMMNDARFQVGLQGLGVAEAAYQGALTYAKERLQSRAPQGVQQPEEKADAILHQPDVRRMLLTQKSLTEACRAMSLLYAKQVDIARFGTPEAAHTAEELLAFLTPITKAFFTDVGQEVAQIGVQVFGGHGFIREWGMEQLIRDVRVTQLYEGTNGIQALDLASRKLARDGGKLLATCHQYFSDMIGKMAQPEAALALLEEWNSTSQQILSLSPVEVASSAHDYLNYSAYCLHGLLWMSMADTAQKQDDQALAQDKQATCQFYLNRILPRKEVHKATLLLAPDDLFAVGFAG